MIRRLARSILLVTVALAGVVDVPDAYAQQEIIVRLDASAPTDLGAALRGSPSKRQAAILSDVVAVRPVSESGGTAAPFRDVFALRLKPDADVGRAVSRWAGREGVAYAQVNHVYTVDAPPAPAVPHGPLDSLDHLHVIRADEAWEITQGRSDVVMGFVDTGLFREHPEFAGQLWVNAGEDVDGDGRITGADSNGVDDDGNGYVDDFHGFDFVDRPHDDGNGDMRDRDAEPWESPGVGHGHGTLVAGVMAARATDAGSAAGVAPRALLLPLRAFGPDGRGQDDDIAAAIVYAADAGVDVLNLSFGDVYYSPVMHDAVRYAVDRGTVVVASAGNVGGDNPHYPSDYAEVVSAAWFNRDGTDVAAEGTYGVGVEFGAPSTAVFTTRMPPPTDDAVLYGRYSGSSLAAPMVAGTAALLRSVDASLSPASIRSILTASARDVREPGWDHATGAGCLDAGTALRHALPAKARIHAPDALDGFSTGLVPIVATAIDPSFETMSVQVSPGDTEPFKWTLLAEETGRQVVRDTVARWPVDEWDEGLYTLRLAVTLRDGRTLEDRRRVYVERSPPELHVRVLDDGLVAGAHGVVAEVTTDDLTRVNMIVGTPAGADQVTSDRRARRHGLTWRDEDGRGGTVNIKLKATNASGLATQVSRSLVVPVRDWHGAFVDDHGPTLPEGYLLPETTDLDGDGLREVTMNVYDGGVLTDTLATYEWDGSGFRRVAASRVIVGADLGGADRFPVGAIPRDVGDVNGDGRADLLASSDLSSVMLTSSSEASFFDDMIFRDDTSRALFGAVLYDLDGDGRDELLAHDRRSWQVYAFDDGRSLVRLDSLSNTTGAYGSEVAGNGFQQPRALVSDLDGNGVPEILVGDEDGDLMMYRWENGRARHTWTHETDRYAAGTRFAASDFDGDGRREIVTYTENWKGNRSDLEQELPLAYYHLWRVNAQGAIVSVDSLPVTAGDLSVQNAVRVVDFYGDGEPELVFVHPPDLYVLRVHRDGWKVLHHRRQSGAAYGFRSTQAVDDDFGGDGRSELLVGAADGAVHRLAAPVGRVAAPPQWVRARALDASTVQLGWHAPAADSVRVYAGAPGQALDLLTTSTGDRVEMERDQPTDYALSAWRGGQLSPLSDRRVVRPHAPAVVQRVAYPDERTVRIWFSRRLHEDLKPEQFVLADGRRPETVLRTEGGYSAVASFERIAGDRASLRFVDVLDVEETPVADTVLALSFPARAAPSMTVARWSVLDAHSVELTFSEPLDEGTPPVPSNFEATPGRVETVDWDAGQPEQVVVRVDGAVLGATGRTTTLRVTGLRGHTGGRLPEEGVALRLNQPAESLADVYVFPNPLEVARHGTEMMIAGLPPQATVQVLTPAGVFVRRLQETDGDGGAPWDLRDHDGRPVPSGVYLIRVETEDDAAVLTKAAVFR